MNRPAKKGKSTVRDEIKKPGAESRPWMPCGRNYHDYEVYMEQHPDTAVVQMDSVIGSKGGKVLLTIYFVNVTDAGVPAGKRTPQSQ